MHKRILKRFIWPGIALIAVLVVGTVGYWLITQQQYSFLDTFYMTVITISTIGFGEVIDVSAIPAGRIFTIFIAISGIGVLFYIVTHFTALVVEGELTKSFRRRKMERKAKHYKNHYIICGIGDLGFHIANELSATKRPYLVIDISMENIERILESLKDIVFIQGDATDNDILLKAGIEHAKGIFATMGDDNLNLVVTLTAKQLNPFVRVVSRCNDLRNDGKMKTAGADAVISPCFIGGLRMASEMIRPTVVSFLDTMLREKEQNLRVEEVSIPDSLAGKPIAALNLKRFPHMLVLAVRTREDWTFNPSESYVIEPASNLVFMATPDVRCELEKTLDTLT
ncbi:MAG: potassium channel protein [Desulfobacteraceae bacterium]|nr:potassium channel protein [Desulfobacteraceae bacterium]